MKSSSIITRLFALFIPTLLLPACDADEAENPDPDADVAPEDDFEEPAEPPSNWTKLNTSTAPTKLEVYANGAGAGSGTNASLEVKYINKAGTYGCTLSSGVPAGTTRTCVPSMLSTTASSDEDRFLVGFSNSNNSSDGLRYSTVRVTLNGTSYAVNEFKPDSSIVGDFDCQGCDVLGYCGSCWLDGAGHGKCLKVKLTMDINQGFPVECMEWFN